MGLIPHFLKDKIGFESIKGIEGSLFVYFRWTLFTFLHRDQAEESRHPNFT